MDKGEPKRERSAELRQEAEARLSELEEETEQILSQVDARALVHELQVHQIELEMQNEELIHARAQAEDALEKYTDLYAFAPIGYFTLDHKGVISECNFAGAEMLASTRSEMIGADFRFYVARDFLVDFEDCLQEALESGERSSCELRLLRRARPGQYVRLVMSATPGTLEEPRQCRAAVIDLSEIRLAEAKLRRSYDEMEERVDQRTAELAEARDESERRAAELQSVLASIVDGVMLVDAAGHVTYINDAGIRIFEAPDDEAFENWHTRLLRYKIDGTPLALEETAMYRALHGSSVIGFQARAVTPWGKEAVLELTASPVRDSAGRLLGAALVFRDIAGRVEWERRREELLERERHVSEVLQQALIPPQREYEMNSCRIAVMYQAASEEASIGGDFYDVFDLGEGKLGIVIGDITGKGLQAAFRVGAIRHSIRSYAYLDSSPAKVMTRVNEAMCKGQEEGMEMLTAFFGVIDTATGEVAFTSAGHEPPFIRHRNGTVSEPDQYDRALGMTAGHPYSEATYQMQQDDVLVVFTDGITEAISAERKFFDREGIAEYLKRSNLTEPAEVAAGLLSAATEFAQGKLRDDAAIVVLTFSQ